MRINTQTIFILLLMVLSATVNAQLPFSFPDAGGVEGWIAQMSAFKNVFAERTETMKRNKVKSIRFKKPIVEAEYFYNEDGLNTRYLFTDGKLSSGRNLMYDSEGRMIEETRYIHMNRDTAKMENTSIYKYDTEGKLSEMQNGSISGEPLSSYSKINYSGNLPVSILYYWNTDSVPQILYQLSIISDESGRIISMEGKDSLSLTKINYEGDDVIFTQLRILNTRYIIKENRLMSINRTVFTSFITEYFYKENGLIEYEIYTETKTGKQEKTIFEYEFYQ